MHFLALVYDPDKGKFNWKSYPEDFQDKLRADLEQERVQTGNPELGNPDVPGRLSGTVNERSIMQMVAELHKHPDETRQLRAYTKTLRKKERKSSSNRRKQGQQSASSKLVRAELN